MITARWILGLGLAFALGASPAAADKVLVRTQKVGKQTITTIETLTPPPVLGKDQFGKAWAKGVVLTAKDWTCGQKFTDETGRHWRLVYGPPLSDKPGAISGWLIQPETGRLHFFTVSGSLFRECFLGAPAPLPIVLPKDKDKEKDKDKDKKE